MQKSNANMKIILLNDRGARKAIMLALDCTYPTIRSALKFESDTDLCKRIRRMALKSGGRVMVGS